MIHFPPTNGVLMAHSYVKMFILWWLLLIWLCITSRILESGIKCVIDRIVVVLESSGKEIV